MEKDIQKESNDTGKTTSSDNEVQINKENEEISKQISEKINGDFPVNFSTTKPQQSYRPTQLDELKIISESSKYDFNNKFNSFLNYVKAKKADESSVYIKNDILDLTRQVQQQSENENTKEEGKQQKENQEIYLSYQSLKPVENFTSVQKNSISLIVDLNNFIDKSSYEIGPLNGTLLESYLVSLKNLGMLLILADMATMMSFEKFFKDMNEKEPNTNFLIKSIIVTKYPLVSLISIQKFEGKTKVVFSNMKIHLAEFWDKNSLNIAKINDLNFIELNRVYSYLYQIQQISSILKNTIAGKTIKVGIKKEIWSQKTDFFAYITDSTNPILRARKNITCILVTSSYANEFIYISSKGREGLCEQAASSRIVLIRPNDFNHDNPNRMKEILFSYCGKLFAYDNMDYNNIKFMTLSENPNFIELYSDDNILVRDVKEYSGKKDSYRQLIYKQFPNLVTGEIRLFNVPEIDAKSSTLKPIKTSKQVKNKKQKTCVDVHVIATHFIKVALSSMHFLDCSNWEQKPIEVLITDAGIGLLPYYAKRTFKEYVKVTALEENEKMIEIGKEYFGLDEVEIDWKISSTQKFFRSKIDHNQHINKLLAEKSQQIEKNDQNTNEKETKKEKKNKLTLFDLIIINQNNFKVGQSVSPDPSILTTEYLKSLRTILTACGCIVFYLSSNSQEVYDNQMGLILKAFQTVYSIENSEDLHQIVVCCNNDNQVGKLLLVEYFYKNNELFRNTSDFYLLGRDYEKIIPKLIYRGEKRLVGQ